MSEEIKVIKENLLSLKQKEMITTFLKSQEKNFSAFVSNTFNVGIGRSSNFCDDIIGRLQEQPTGDEDDFISPIKAKG